MQFFTSRIAARPLLVGVLMVAALVGVVAVAIAVPCLGGNTEKAVAQVPKVSQLGHVSPPGQQTRTLCPSDGNEGFEDGVVGTDTIPCWTVLDQANGAGSWCNQTGTLPPQGTCSGSSTSVAAPPEGSQAVMTNQGGPGSHVLYQCGVLKSGAISFQLYINNEAGTFVNPSSLDYQVYPNQQFRADLVSATAIAANPFSVAPEDVLLNVYQTLPGDPPLSGYVPVVADASAYMGQEVCLRFSEVENLFFFHAGVDDVHVDLRQKKGAH